MTRHLPILRAATLVLSLLGLTGCSALSALTDATTPLEVYELRAPGDLPVSRGTPLPVAVTIETPTTSGALQTDRIMIRPDPYQAQYLPEVRWSEELPVMVQTLMLRSLESTQALTYVGRTPLGADSAYAVVTEVTDFQAESAGEGQPVTVRLRMRTSIVRESDVQIVAARTFGATAQSPETDVANLVRAFDSASNVMMRDFALWVTATLGRRL